MAISFTCMHQKKLDVVYHSALRFVTGANARTHHCKLYEMVQWTSLYLRRKTHILIFIAKALMGKLPNYISSLLSQHISAYSTRSSEKMLLTVLTSRIEIGKTAFQIYAPFVWNEFQSVHNLHSFTTFTLS